MEPLMRISEEDEAEFKIMTKNMYENGGAFNVLACVSTMQRVQIIILTKLNELLKEDRAKL